MKCKKLLVGSLILTSVFMMACSSESEQSDDATSYIETMEENAFYVRHEDEDGNVKDIEKTAVGAASFDEKATTTTPQDNRVIMFREDFENIPTLYEGDSLIYYTNEVLDEEFTIERFEDYGYTIGVCNMEVTPSGRYKVSTDSDKRNTYPGGDTDEMIKFENKEVIIDSLGGHYLRADDIKEGTSKDLTRSGTLLGLEPFQKYEAKVYAGTVENNFVFTSDVRALGSMEIWKSTDYNFESEKLIKINIPEYFNSGYYFINNIGMFRYVKGTEYDENTDFNIPNNAENYEYIASTLNSTEGDNFKVLETNSTTDGIRSSIDLENLGTTTVEIKFVAAQGKKSSNADFPSAILTSPSGANYKLQKQEDNSLQTTLEVEELGKYTISYYDLGSFVPYINIY